MFCRPKNRLSQFISTLAAAACAAGLFFCQDFSASAANASEERLEKNRAMPVQSNDIEGWPDGPIVGAEAAILMEAGTGTVLYSKNIHWKEYPASTTKILTTLMAVELCELDEVVNFSHDAVFDNPRGSSGIAMDVGQALTMEQCLNAILIRSANEVAFAVAEHITGTSNWQVFADEMNRRAEELGALNTHFVNPNGLPDDNHYTTAYDLAMISRPFFENDLLCRISLTRRLEIPASDRLPKAKLELNSMQIIPTGTYAYPYIVGCKTGYTEAARSCLVSCAEKDGMKLICVVLRDEAPFQYTDTIALFDYGFSNFTKVNVSQEDVKYDLDDGVLPYRGNDIFGDSDPFIAPDSEAYLVLPVTAALNELKTSIRYEPTDERRAAVVTYTCHGVEVGSVDINFVSDRKETSLFGMPVGSAESEAPTSPVVYVDITSILAVLAISAVLIFVGMMLHSVLKNYNFSLFRRSDSRKRPKKRRLESEFKDYDF